MSKNKWNKDTEVKKVVLTDEDFETVKEIVSKPTTFIEPETFSEVSVNESFVSDIQLEMMKQAKLEGIEMVLDILYNYKKGMHDDTYSIRTEIVADWLKIKLKQMGYEV